MDISYNFSLEDIQKDYLKKDFLNKLYFYYINKGYYNIIYKHLSNIFSGLFMIFYVIFIYNCILWDVIMASKNRIHLNDAVDISNFFKFNLFIFIFFLSYMTIIFFRILNLVSDIQNMKEIKTFYNDNLEINDFDLSIIKWNDIIKKLYEKNNDSNITIFFVNNKISTIDNYMVSLIDHNIVKITNITSLMEWNIKYCFIQSLFKNNKINPNFLFMNKKFMNDIKNKMLTVICVNFLFMPFILNYIIFYNLISNGEKLYNKPSFIISRSWTLMFKWKARNYNELKHEYEERLVLSEKPCKEYTDQFSNKIIETICKFFTFIFNSIFITFIFIGIINEKMLLNMYIFENKTLFWCIGLMGSIIAIIRLNIKEKSTYYPDEKMNEIQEIINFIPDTWKDINNKEFFKYYKPHYMILFNEIINTLNTPFYMFSLYLQAETIFIFLKDITINSSEYGHINKYSIFSNENNNKKTNDSIKTFKKNNNIYI